MDHKFVLENSSSGAVNTLLSTKLCAVFEYQAEADLLNRPGT